MEQLQSKDQLIADFSNSAREFDQLVLDNPRALPSDNKFWDVSMQCNESRLKYETNYGMNILKNMEIGTRNLLFRSLEALYDRVDGMDASQEQEYEREFLDSLCMNIAGYTYGITPIRKEEI